MKKIGMILLMELFCMRVNAQFNLVPNPSFEDTVAGCSCYCIGAIELCVKEWFNPHGATPDYYTYFPGYCSGVSSVNNPSGFQIAKTGVSYSGIYGMASPTREYIAIKLTDSLRQGECYYAEFFISLANLARYAIDNLGCYFTNDTSGFKSITTNIPAVPQILNQAGNFLSDTLNWQKVNGTFTASGGETFLIIGNFYDDANTSLDTVNPGSTWHGSYYYIEDVLVTPCDSIAGISNNSISKRIIYYPMPAINNLRIISTCSIQHCKIKLFDLSGTELNFKIFIKKTGNGWNLDISNLSSGIYLLTVIDHINGNSQLKIIKQ